MKRAGCYQRNETELTLVKKKKYICIHNCLLLLLLLRLFSLAQLCVTPWTAAHQAPLSMGFSRQEYWGGLPFPSAGDLPDPGIEPMSPVSPALQADSLPAQP